MPADLDTTPIEETLAGRTDADRHPRVIRGLAAENVGDWPDRRDSIRWRARIAGTVARSRARRDAWATSIPRPNRAQRRAAERIRR